VFDFEKNVVQLFKSHDIHCQFDFKSHYLDSEALAITFVPNCSLKDFAAPPEKTSGANKSIRLWEDEYFSHQQIIESRILSLIGVSRSIYARETIVSEISREDLDNFLVINHLNSPVTAKHRYGLYYQQNLVAVVAFSRSCPIQSGGITYRSHELVRYCSLLNSTVVGGLSKLISHFEHDKKPEHLMTYVDKEWSDGGAYKKLGFKSVMTTPPQKFWLAPNRKERTPDKIITENKSVGELENRGWTPLYNLGSFKLVKFLK
jgi:hypothetical protein